MFSEKVRILEHNEKIILVNTDTGQWIRLSKTVYDIIRQVVVREISCNDLFTALVDDDDREYIKCTLKEMEDIGIFSNKSEKNISGKTVIFEVTNRCNLHCIHCCNNSDIKSDFELSTDQIFKILNFVIINQPSMVTITGGEPLVRADFLDIIQYLRSKYNGKISLMTNGILISSNNVSHIIRNIDEVNISIDGVDEKTTDKIRGKGVFNKVLKAVKVLQNNGFTNITLSIVLGDKNYFMQDAFLELNKRLGTKPLIRGFTEIGRGKNSKSVFSTDVGLQNVEEVFAEKNLMTAYTKNLSPCSCSAGKKRY